MGAPLPAPPPCSGSLRWDKAEHEGVRGLGAAPHYLAGPCWATSGLHEGWMLPGPCFLGGALWLNRWDELGFPRHAAGVLHFCEDTWRRDKTKKETDILWVHRKTVWTYEDNRQPASIGNWVKHPLEHIDTRVGTFIHWKWTFTHRSFC